MIDLLFAAVQVCVTSNKPVRCVTGAAGSERVKIVVCFACSPLT